MKALSLTAKDIDLFRSFKTLLQIDGKGEFCSDDFRMYGLDRYYEDRAHGVGGFFARCVHGGLIRAVGERRSLLPSNHMRRIRVYVLTGKGQGFGKPYLKGGV